MTTDELKKELIAKIEPIIEKHGTANFANDTYCGYVPVVYSTPNDTENTFTIDRVYMEQNNRLKKKEVAAAYSSAYSCDWDYLRNIPVEVVEEILECLEDDAEFATLFFDDADEEDE